MMLLLFALRATTINILLVIYIYDIVSLIFLEASRSCLNLLVKKLFYFIEVPGIVHYEMLLTISIYFISHKSKE